MYQSRAPLFNFRIKAIAIVALLAGCFSIMANSKEIKDKKDENLPRPAEPFQRFSWETEFDPYYSNTGLFVNLTDKPVPDLSGQSEASIYRDLILRSYKPRFAVIEASVNPLPYLGAIIKDKDPSLYDDALISESLNVIEVLTAGFEEPYAVSVFLGNLVTYGKDGENTNKGFMGYLFSHGDKHLVRNEAIDDNWYEFEWKIKGTIQTQKRKLDWSFRSGGKFHDNPLISDVFYVGLRRDHLSNSTGWRSLISNGGLDCYFEYDRDKLAPTQQKFMIHKNIPLEDGAAWKLAFGIIRTNERRYQKPLSINNEIQFVFMPTLTF